jgi:hypothetical protein
MIILITVGQSVGISSANIVQNSTVKETINNGKPVNFNDRTINGELILGDGMIIDERFHFRNASFLNRVIFNSSVFKENADFSNATFNGDVQFICSTFSGDADFSHSVFNKDVSFSDSTFNGPASFESSVFKNRSYFKNSIFNGPSHFDGANFSILAAFDNSTFNGLSYFDRSTFNHLASFNSSSFAGDAHFESSTFNGNSSFVLSSFNRTADFSHSVFNENASFSDSTFNGPAHFDGANFSILAAFDNSTFNGPSYFDRSTFNHLASFNSSSFAGDAHFESSTFNGNSSFVLSSFNRTADFSSSVFKNATSFISCSFDKEANFNDVMFKNKSSFNRSQFKGDALFNDAFFNGTLYLTRTKYDKIYIKWDNITDLAYDESAYQLLIENFKKLGFNKDADNCYYEFRRDQLLHWGTPDDSTGVLIETGRYLNRELIYEYGLGDKLMHALDFGALVFYGYGKRPLYPLTWSIITVILFGIAWWLGDWKAPINNINNSGSGIFERYGSGSSAHSTLPEDKGNKGWRDESRLLADAMIFSATIFLSGTKLFVDPPGLPEMPRWSKSKTKTTITAERVLGAFFSILFFLSIGATVVR